MRYRALVIACALLGTAALPAGASAGTLDLHWVEAGPVPDAGYTPFVRARQGRTFLGGTARHFTFRAPAGRYRIAAWWKSGGERSPACVRRLRMPARGTVRWTVVADFSLGRCVIRPGHPAG